MSTESRATLDQHVADPLGDIFRLTVDERSLEQMIAGGRYDYVGSDITATRFPITTDQVGEWEARYFHFNIDIESPDAKACIEAEDPENPWQAAHIGHLLAHGATHPAEQRTFPIIALGSVAEVHGYPYVPYLDRYGAPRYLYLNLWRYGWHRYCRFLAVRKVSDAPASERPAAA